MPSEIIKHFQLNELIDKETYTEYGSNALRFIRTDALILLEKIRAHFNTPITINNWHKGGEYNWSGLRSPKYKNYKITSLHSWGAAWDMKFSKLDIRTVREEIIDKRDVLFPELMGIELGTKTWIHIDTRYIKDRILFRFSP